MSSSSYAHAAIALPVTAVCAGYSGALLASLSVPVGLYRADNKLMHGTGVEGAHKGFVQRVRAHANATENIPIFLIQLAALEHNRTLSHQTLLNVGLAFCVLRTLHSVQILHPDKLPVAVRAVSFLGQQALIAGAGVALLYAGAKAIGWL